MNFAVIGTRGITDKDKAWVREKLMTERISALNGRVLHTGACQGVDQFAVEEWLSFGGEVHLHLPWYRYEIDWHTN